MKKTSKQWVLVFVVILCAGCATQKQLNARLQNAEKRLNDQEKRLTDQEHRIFYLQKELNSLKIDTVLLQQDIEDVTDEILDACRDDEGC